MNLSFSTSDVARIIYHDLASKSLNRRRAPEPTTISQGSVATHFRYDWIWIFNENSLLSVPVKE